MAFVKVQDRRNERAEFLLTRLTELVKWQEQNDLEMGKVLLEIKTGEFYKLWGFTSFGKWLESRPRGLTYTKGFYLVSIAAKLKSARIPSDIADAVGISKLRYINAAVKNPDDFRDIVVEEAKNPKAFNETMKKVARDTGTRPRHIWNFSLYDPAEIKTVEQAIRAIRANRTLSESQAFLEICREYLKYVR